MADATKVSHKFRDTIWADWQEIVIDKDVITFNKSNALSVLIPISEIDSVQIIKSFGDGFSCVIRHNKNRKIKIHTGAIKRFGQPIQNLHSFADLLQTLKQHPQADFNYLVGSNKLYYFSLISLIIVIPLIVILIGVAINKNGMPLHVIMKITVTLILLLLFGLPLIKNGKVKSVKQLDELPYQLETLLIQTE